MGFGAMFLLNYTFLYFSKFSPSLPNHCHSKRKPGVAFCLHLVYQLRQALLWPKTGADRPEAPRGLALAPQAWRAGSGCGWAWCSPDELRPVSSSLYPAGLASFSGRCSLVVASQLWWPWTCVFPASSAGGQLLSCNYWATCPRYILTPETEVAPSALGTQARQRGQEGFLEGIWCRKREYKITNVFLPTSRKKQGGESLGEGKLL